MLVLHWKGSSTTGNSPIHWRFNALHLHEPLNINHRTAVTKALSPASRPTQQTPTQRPEEKRHAGTAEERVKKSLKQQEKVFKDDFYYTTHSGQNKERLAACWTNGGLLRFLAGGSGQAGKTMVVVSPRGWTKVLLKKTNCDVLFIQNINFHRDSSRGMKKRSVVGHTFMPMMVYKYATITVFKRRKKEMVTNAGGRFGGDQSQILGINRWRCLELKEEFSDTFCHFNCCPSAVAHNLFNASQVPTEVGPTVANCGSGE